MRPAAAVNISTDLLSRLEEMLGTIIIFAARNGSLIFISMTKNNDLFHCVVIKNQRNEIAQWIGITKPVISTAISAGISGKILLGSPMQSIPTCLFSIVRQLRQEARIAAVVKVGCNRCLLHRSRGLRAATICSMIFPTSYLSSPSWRGA